MPSFRGRGRWLYERRRSRGRSAASPGRCRAHDGDRIHAVIRGSMLNAGGRTTGYTVPSPQSQAQVVTGALRRARIHPRTLSYVEAHGTGTALGDPIEIRGLQQAFSPFTTDRQFCALGSVKSGIGHLEAAAGIASLTKVVLQLQHRMLVPSLHAETPNPLLDLERSPFYLQRDCAAWRRPTLNLDGAERIYPRRAGVSSFGAGGRICTWCWKNSTNCNPNWPRSVSGCSSSSSQRRRKHRFGNT